MPDDPSDQDNQRGSSRPKVLHARVPRILLGLLLVVVSAVWLLSANRDLPYINHPDEPTNLRVANHMVESGDPNPHFFNYPSLFFYIHAATNLDGPLLGWLGKEQDPVSLNMGVTKSNTPRSVAVHRAVSVILALLALVAAYKSALLLTRRHYLSLLAPALLAVSVTFTANAQLVTPDVLAVALVTATLWASLSVFNNPRWVTHILAGFTAGLAASSKYNAVLVLATVAVASMLSHGSEDHSYWQKGELIRRILKLVTVGLASTFAFVLTTPYSWLDHSKFLKDIRFEMHHYATGHPGMDGNAPSWYLNYLLTHELFILVAAVVGLAFAIMYRKWRELAALLVFPLIYGSFIASQAVRNSRTALPLLPSLALITVLGVGALADNFKPVLLKKFSSIFRSAGAVLLCLIFMLQIFKVLPTLNFSESTYAQSREWILQNIDSGSRILAEAYSPWVDPKLYSVTYKSSLVGARIPAAGGYVIASAKMFKRYVDDEHRFPLEAAAYRQLFSSLRKVAEFHGHGSTILIFAVD